MEIMLCKRIDGQITSTHGQTVEDGQTASTGGQTANVQEAQTATI